MFSGRAGGGEVVINYKGQKQPLAWREEILYISSQIACVIQQYIVQILILSFQFD